MISRAAAVVVAAFLLAGPLPASATDVTTAQHAEIVATYRHIADEYYKATSPAILLNGARDRIVAFLKSKGIAQPVVPAVHPNVSDDEANMRSLVTLLNAVEKTYGSRFDMRTLMYQELTGLAQSVKDRYTVFLPPHDFAALNEGLDGGNFSGVGLSIEVDPQTKLLHVNEVIPNGPAEKAGVRENDTIVEIDGKSTKNASIEADSKKLRGKAGSAVRLAIVRNGVRVKPYELTRAVIHEPSVTSKMLPNGIGYAHLTVFGTSTGRELNEALTRLHDDGAKALILDLRDNGGGYLTAAVDVASKFVPSGAIVSVEDRGGSNTQYDAEDTAIPPQPLAVLVNRFTASASEITSGAIQDNGTGTLIGTRTFGKGVVQTIYPLSDGAAIKVTTARYFTPHGRDINTVGIQPDIKSDIAKDGRIGDPARDAQLQSAITFLQGKMAEAAKAAESSASE